MEDLLKKAIETTIKAGACNVNYLQRNLHIGCNKAKQLILQMEEMGIIGPQNGAKPREVIKSKIPSIQEDVKRQLKIKE